jgi:enoyl-[acyl-carrier-protein] reductase (NADH)
MGITVNAVAPVALTRMTEDLALFRGASAEDLGPQHIAPVVVFLASELASDVTGQIVGVQGGKIFLYRVESTDGVEREAGSIWTAQAIHEAWDRIGA